ncbi:MAG: ABC transporter substrate-binding protein [Proteobacteria bacterium]|nr:ABC transporter substrate-binding protein [Pseudomonadota bacterium]
MVKANGKAAAWLILIGGALVLALGGVSRAAEPKPLVVGHLGEWTGPAGRTCGPLGDAVILYINEIVNKEKGGIPYKDTKTGESGRVKVKLLYADCRYELPLFKSAYRDFVDKGMVLVHTTASPAIEGLKKDYKRDKIPCFMSTANTVGMWPPEWVMGIAPTFADDLGLCADWLKKNWKESRPPRVALMYYDGPLGRSMLWGGVDYLKAKGIEIVADEPVAPMPVDMTSQLLRVQQAKADWILVLCTGSQSAVIRKDMKRLGMQTPFLQISGTDAQEMMALAGDAAEGMFYQIGYPTSWDEEKYPGVKWINESYRKYMRGKPGYDVDQRPLPDMVWWLGWIMGNYIEEVLRLSLEVVPPDKLTGKDVMEQGFFRINDFRFPGLGTSPGMGLKYIPWKDHRGTRHGVIHQIKAMRDNMITGWEETPLILPPWMNEKK